MSVSDARKTKAALSGHLAAAFRTLQTESDGLAALAAAMADGLGGRFLEAVETIRAARGRVIVTGIGKSGHIARKIAATLASTGTPAFFVHAADASHGDLGMITSDDVMLTLSWSGETEELKELINYSRRFRIALIAVTGNVESTLGQAADIVLVLPPAREACPHNLMHPGAAVPLIGRNAPMSEAIVEMSAKGFGCVAIVEATGKLAGVITDGDLRRHMRADLLQASVDAVMTASPKTIRPDQLASEALQLLNESKITALIVVEADRPVGIVHFHDLLRAGVA